MPGGAWKAGRAAGQDAGKASARAALEAEQGREGCKAGGKDLSVREELEQLCCGAAQRRAQNRY